MITADGWVSWAIRLPATVGHVNPGVNAVKGIFLHSAEGYAATLLDPRSQWGYNGNNSWQLTNLFDGTLYQHYPLTARCWHATAANNDYVGMENEGDAPKEPSLTEPQIETVVRLIRDLSAWKGWKPTRTGDTSQTLWEHNEVVWLGGSGTNCPNGRIPWAEILRRLEGQEEDEMVTEHDGWGLAGFEVPAGQRVTVNAQQEFGVPPGAKRIHLEVLSERGYAVILNGSGTQSGRVGWARAGNIADGYEHSDVFLGPDGTFHIWAEDQTNPPRFFTAHVTAWA